MGKRIISIRLGLTSMRIIPHILLYLSNRRIFDKDLVMYSSIKMGGVKRFVSVMAFQKVYRNLFYYRIGYHKSWFIKWMLPEEKSLHVSSPYIGEGAHFQHNYSTILNCRGIGKKFFCLHLVTIGRGKGGLPIIGDDVKIFTNATIYGGIRIGNHVRIGAGAVVDKDIPDNCIVAGNPARIIKREGKNVNELL